MCFYNDGNVDEKKDKDFGKLRSFNFQTNLQQEYLFQADREKAVIMTSALLSSVYSMHVQVKQ